MHERIRAVDPDTFGEVALGIISFAAGDNDCRVARLDTDAGVALYSFEELDGMVRETYELWQQVLNEREEEVRRRASGR